MSTQLRKHVAVKDERFKFSVPPGDIYLPLFIRQEFDEYGNHRLVCILSEAKGDWVGNGSISTLDVGQVYVFYGTSDYYKGVLPRVFLAYEPKRIGVGDGSEARKREEAATRAKPIAQNDLVKLEISLPPGSRLQQCHSTSIAQHASKGASQPCTPSPKEKRSPVMVLVVGALGAWMVALVIVARIVAFQ